MTNGIDRILATGCSLSAIAVIMACFFAYKCFTQAVLNGYEATMTKIIELLSYAHTVYIKTQTPPKEISSCTVNNALNNDRNTNNASPLMPIVDYWEQEIVLLRTELDKRRTSASMSRRKVGNDGRASA